MREDIIAIANDVVGALSKEEEIVKLNSITITTGNKSKPEATVELLINKEKKSETSIGVGPVDAAAKAIKKIIGPSFVLNEYNLNAITGGTNALAHVSLKVSDENNNLHSAEAVDSDVIMASVKAMIKAANKVLARGKK